MRSEQFIRRGLVTAVGLGAGSLAGYIAALEIRDRRQMAKFNERYALEQKRNRWEWTQALERAGLRADLPIHDLNLGFKRDHGPYDVDRRYQVIKVFPILNFSWHVPGETDSTTFSSHVELEKVRFCVDPDPQSPASALLEFEPHVVSNGKILFRGFSEGDYSDVPSHASARIWLGQGDYDRLARSQSALDPKMSNPAATALD